MDAVTLRSLCSIEYNRAMFLIWLSASTEIKHENKKNDDDGNAYIELETIAFPQDLLLKNREEDRMCEVVHLIEGGNMEICKYACCFLLMYGFHFESTVYLSLSRCIARARLGIALRSSCCDINDFNGPSRADCTVNMAERGTTNTLSPSSNILVTLSPNPTTGNSANSTESL